MATECVLDLKGCSGSLTAKYSDESWSERFRVSLDSPNRVGPSICNLARLANPTQFPLKGQAWPAAPSYGLYAKNFQLDPIGDLQKDWHITVTYLPLQPGEQNTEGSNDNPLLWPATFSLEWVEYEEAITQARNVAAIGALSGSTRAANTLGPVVNGALQEFDEGIFKTVRRPVLCILKNVATLNEVLSIESTYADTTNSDTVYGVGPRRYQYLSVDAPGMQTANGITFYPRMTRVAVQKTTDRIIQNVGWHYYKLVEEGPSLGWKLVKHKVNVVDDEGVSTGAKEDASEPAFIKDNGEFSAAPTTITYRYLTEVAYSSLLT